MAVGAASLFGRSLWESSRAVGVAVLAFCTVLRALGGRIRVETVVVDDVTRTIRYRGPTKRARMVVVMLEREGVTVDWAPPSPSVQLARSLSKTIVGDLNEVAVQMVATGSVMAIAAAVKNFREQGDDPRSGSGELCVTGIPSDP